MRAGEVSQVLNLEAALRARVVGQDHALRAVAEAIRISRAGLTDPRKPVGVFLMVGTSGVGKTETAAALADILYGGAQSLTTINMTEFKEEHKVSLLMGSPPGYVGYGEGGVLTEAVRRRPHSVLLLDEIEKAHPGVQDVFFQVFDKGTMKDGEGRDIDFRNTVIIMTTNACSDTIASLFADPDTAPDAAGLGAVLRERLLQYFKPAFLGRLVLTPYLPLDDTVLERICEMRLARLAESVHARYGAELVVSDAGARTARRQGGDRTLGCAQHRRTDQRHAHARAGGLFSGLPARPASAAIDRTGRRGERRGRGRAVLRGTRLILAVSTCNRRDRAAWRLKERQRVLHRPACAGSGAGHPDVRRRGVRDDRLRANGSVACSGQGFHRAGPFIE